MHVWLLCVKICKIYHLLNINKQNHVKIKKDIKKSFPPSKCKTRISSNLSTPLFSTAALFLSTYTDIVISQLFPVKRLNVNSKIKITIKE